MTPAVSEDRSKVFAFAPNLKVARLIFFPYQFTAYPIGKEQSGGPWDSRFTTMKESFNYSKAPFILSEPGRLK